MLAFQLFDLLLGILRHDLKVCRSLRLGEGFEILSIHDELRHEELDLKVVKKVDIGGDVGGLRECDLE